MSRAITKLGRAALLCQPPPASALGRSAGGGAARMSTVVEHPRIRTSPSPPPPAPDSHEDIEQRRRQKAKEILQKAVAATAPRHDWTKEEIAAIYYQPLTELTYQAVSPFPSRHRL